LDQSVLDSQRLVSRLKAIKPARLDITGYRSATPKYAKETDLLTGEGSRLHGGRWNPPGIAAVYASFTPETAMEETLAHFRYYGIPLHAAMPRIFVAIRAQLTKVLDLTEGVNRRRIQIAESRLLECDWRDDVKRGKESLTQLLGRAAKAAGFEAMIVRSAAAKAGYNMVIFPENLRTASQLSVLDPEKLSPNRTL
jgi:RES domain-containing protein